MPPDILSSRAGRIIRERREKKAHAKASALTEELENWMDLKFVNYSFGRRFPARSLSKRPTDRGKLLSILPRTRTYVGIAESLPSSLAFPSFFYATTTNADERTWLALI